MKYLFITAIHNLKLEKLECRIPLTSGMISNKEGLLKDILSYKSRLALDTLGVHSIDEFKNKVFYIVEGEFDVSITKEKINPFGTMLTFAFLRQIQSVIDELWLIRDNAVQALIENNDIKAKRLMDLLTVYLPKHFFCVSIDKAANPVNIKRASKRIMEDLVMAYNKYFKVTTARFANVAFSNGSLPDGWIHRLQKKQPLLWM